MINIVKASAGSGKTFKLAKTYIELLLRSEDRYAYRHILAVTFTNKATGEMKNRVLKELDILAREPQASGYYNDFVKEFGPEEKLRKRAEDLLYNILHDYGAFAISTIDKFFQQALKAFAREIGQFSSYQVELDKDSLVRESVDRILDSMTEGDNSLIGWITESVMESLNDQGKFNIEKGLYQTAEKLKSDEHREAVEKYGLDEAKVHLKDDLRNLRRNCLKLMDDYVRRLSDAAEKVLSVFEKAGIRPEDSNGKFISLLWKYVGLKRGSEVKSLSSSFREKAADSTKWFSKDKQSLLPKVEGSLEEPLAELIALFDMPLKAYNTARALNKDIYNLGISSELSEEFNALVKEKNVMCLDDSNILLKRIIGGSDAPFVYEKLGVRFEDFLLDEFQDTSTIQWQNFEPLLRESNDNGRDNLVVGDVKQSIYRWRGSDWRLLSSGIKETFPDSDDSLSLTSNWRSLGAIVDFNNSFFDYAAGVLDSKLSADSHLIRDIYADVAQKAMTDDKARGSVEVTFCEADEQLETILQSISKVREAGASFGHIAVLVRENKDGAKVASYLVDNGIPVISDDSLHAKGSLTVRRLVSLMSCAFNGEDSVSNYLAKSLDVDIPEDYLSLYDLAESLLRSLNAHDASLFEREIIYVQAFMDVLNDWVSVNGNNLQSFLNFWDEYKKDYVSSPEDTDAVRIITIHKAKGLEFPYVIFPYAESVLLADTKRNFHWCRPMSEAAGYGLDGLFNVNLSSGSADSFFADSFETDMLMQAIDNLNVFYVALTRASKGLHIISENPSKTFLGSFDKKGDDAEFKSLSHILYSFVKTRFPDPGQMYDFSKIPPRKALAEYRAASYPSFDIKDRASLKFSDDSAAYFSDEMILTPRVHGIVLHEIMSRVNSSADLRGSVRQAVSAGELSEAEGDKCAEILAKEIEAHGEWFPEDGSVVRNELEIIGTDGRLHKPDRVLTFPDRTVVIDYKFKDYDPGESYRGYFNQVARYMDLYRTMGYPAVEGYLWFIGDSGHVERIG